MIVAFHSQRTTSSSKLIGDYPPSGFIAMWVYRQAGLSQCGFITNGGEILP